MKMHLFTSAKQSLLKFHNWCKTDFHIYTNTGPK